MATMSAFELLGVTELATKQEIETAFRQASISCHPDKGGSNERFLLITWAKAVLSDPATKLAHMAQLCPALPGSRVTLKNLASRPDLNEAAGTAGAFSGLRLTVRLDSGRHIAVKPLCVAVVAGVSTAWASCGRAHAHAAGTAGAWAWASGASASAAAWADSRVPCPGPGGSECPNWAYVSPSKERCKTCWAAATAAAATAAAAPTSAPPAAPAPRSSPQTQQEGAGGITNEACMAAAELIAETLQLSTAPAEEGDLLLATLRRLCLVADTDVVAARVRKLASHAGGVPPLAGKLAPFADTPQVADPGNAIYSVIVTRLIERIGNDATLPPWGLDALRKLNAEHKGDVVEALLAAANAAADREEGKGRVWADLRGGACASSDAVTPFLVRLVHWECR